MKNGWYLLRFKTGNDYGDGMLIFEDGIISGADQSAVRFDGTYGPEGDNIHAVIKVTYPPGVMSVFGIANPYEWSLDFAIVLDPKVDHGHMVVKTPTGHNIGVEYRFLRTLPLAT